MLAGLQARPGWVLLLPPIQLVAAAEGPTVEMLDCCCLPAQTDAAAAAAVPDTITQLILAELLAAAAATAASGWVRGQGQA